MIHRLGCGGSGSVAWQHQADVVVIGTGVAGLVAALAAQRSGRRVVVLSKADESGQTATRYAQGGIAVVLPDSDDSVDAHVADTVAAGGGLCDPRMVRSIVADGYAAVRDLVGLGARFDETAAGHWARTREGGHTRNRVIHAGGDATGVEVQRALDAAASGLDIRCRHAAVQVLVRDGAVAGVLVLNDDGLGLLHAPAVLVAGGGLGQLYSATTNPAGATGDGVALALAAGAAVSDIEFIQFHPTMLFDGHTTGRRPLITEAVRGEGATLIDARGDSIMSGVHPMGDLAPRDVVAAAIEARLAATGTACAFLDARGVADFERRFPTVTAVCRAAGCDPVRQPIPVVPGAHYSCGGVTTDDQGRTTVPGLFAAGESARTGIHGANRLASNSLLEGLVMGTRAGRAAAHHAGASGAVLAAAPTDPGQPAVPRAALQRAMTRFASVLRHGDGLDQLGQLLDTARRRPVRHLADAEDIALTLTARAVSVAARARTESRGCHHRADHPDTDPGQAVSTVVRLDAGRVITEQPVGAV